MSFDGLLIHICYIQTSASSQNSLGEWTYTWTDSSVSTECRMSPITYSERIELPGKFDDVTYRGFFKSGAISIDDRLKFRDKIYRVKESILDSESHHLSTLLVEYT